METINFSSGLSMGGTDDIFNIHASASPTTWLLNTNTNSNSNHGFVPHSHMMGRPGQEHQHKESSFLGGFGEQQENIRQDMGDMASFPAPPITVHVNTTTGNLAGKTRAKSKLASKTKSKNLGTQNQNQTQNQTRKRKSPVSKLALNVNRLEVVNSNIHTTKDGLSQLLFGFDGPLPANALKPDTSIDASAYLSDPDAPKKPTLANSYGSMSDVLRAGAVEAAPQKNQSPEEKRSSDLSRNLSFTPLFAKHGIALSSLSALDSATVHLMFSNAISDSTCTVNAMEPSHGNRQSSPPSEGHNVLFRYKFGDPIPKRFLIKSVKKSKKQKLKGSLDKPRPRKETKKLVNEENTDQVEITAKRQLKAQIRLEKLAIKEKVRTEKQERKERKERERLERKMQRTQKRRIEDTLTTHPKMAKRKQRKMNVDTAGSETFELLSYYHPLEVGENEKPSQAQPFRPIRPATVTAFDLDSKDGFAGFQSETFSFQHLLDME